MSGLEELQRRIAGAPSLWVAQAPGAMIGQTVLVAIFESDLDAQAACDQIAERPLDWERDLNGWRANAGTRRALGTYTIKPTPFVAAEPPETCPLCGGKIRSSRCRDCGTLVGSGEPS